MAYSKELINEMLDRIIRKIDIGEEMFQAANTEYSDLGRWLDAQSEQYAVTIYPQGSFALGTVIKPISDKDDYDLDLVCEFEQQYGLTARQLKCDVVKPWLVNYRKLTGEIENKKRCWHVEYEELPSFHMDIVPAFKNHEGICITDHDEEKDEYAYIGSNPQGYAEWFFSRSEEQWKRLYEQYRKQNGIMHASADVEKLDRFKVKTTLQKAVQLLKRHRDIMFKDNSKQKPVSIIITTLAAQLFNGEDNVLDTVNHILANAEEYIKGNVVNGDYSIKNPSYPSENFADKWNEHPERAEVFFRWLHQAQADFSSERFIAMDRIGMGTAIKKMFGESIGKTIIAELAEADRSAIKAGTMKVATATGAISKKGTMAIPPNHHYHGEI